MQPGPAIPTRAHRADAGARRVRAGAGRQRVAPALVCAALALLACAPALGSAPEFSAEAVYVAMPATPPATATVPPTSSAKLYVSKDKMRIDFVGGVSARSLIVDDADHTIVVLYHDRKTYQLLGSRPAEYFRVADAEHACPAWQQAVGTPIRCQKAGAQRLAGRRTVKYTRPSADGSTDEIWVDPTLNYVIKWRIDAVDMELRSIREGPQPADLFVVPDNYGPVVPRQTRRRQVQRP